MGELIQLSPADLPAPRRPHSSATTSTSCATPPSCELCGDIGWLSSGPSRGALTSPTLIECECGIVARRREEKVQQQHLARATKYLGELRTSLGRLADCTFQTFNVDRPLGDCVWGDTHILPDLQRSGMSKAIIAARLYAASPRGWLYLYGPPGAGKSHLAAAIANDLIGNGEIVAYASVPDILAFVRRGMNDGSADDRFTGLQSVETLILDDMGAENSTPWSVETIFRLIDERDKHDRPTIITSNLHYDSLNARIASRIAGRVTLVPMLISDYRRLRGAA